MWRKGRLENTENEDGGGGVVGDEEKAGEEKG